MQGTQSNTAESSECGVAKMKGSAEAAGGDLYCAWQRGRAM